MIEPRGRSVLVEANGITQHALLYGEPEAPPLVLYPGITSSALTAEFFALDLAEHFAVYVVDIRGRGRTPATPPGTYTLGHYADDAVAFVEALGLERPVLFGHSMGARIAGAVAVRRARARGMTVLVDPPLTGPGRPPYPMSAEAFATQLDEAARGASVEDVRAWFPRWPERELEIRAQELPTCDRTAVLESHENFHREDFFEIWRQIEPPAVLVYGAESPVVTEEGAEELRSTNPRVPVVAVDAAGHMVPWDNREGFTKVVRDILGME